MSQLSGSTGRSYRNGITEESAQPTLVNPYDETSTEDQEFYDEPGPSSFIRPPSDMLRTLAHYGNGDQLELGEEEESGYLDDEYWEDEEEDDGTRFVNFALLSHMAVQLRDKVPRGIHVKGSIPYPRAFTGKDIVVSKTCTPTIASDLMAPLQHIGHYSIPDSTRVSHQSQRINK